ncbi:hypothetical protein D3C85_1752900 [compost metagenome]
MKLSSPTRLSASKGPSKVCSPTLTVNFFTSWIEATAIRVTLEAASALPSRVGQPMSSRMP